MKYIAALLVILLIAKDAGHLGDRYIMRGIGQGLWLIFGFAWVISHIEHINWRAYSLVISYLFVLLVSAALSSYSLEAFIQVASLFAILFFSIAVTENVASSRINRMIMSTTFWMFLLVAVISIVLLKIAPDIVYQVGNIAGGKRFAGLFNRPGMMGVAAGILLGIALFGKFERNIFMKSIRFLAVIVALTCLILAAARTFWVAGIVAIVLTVFRKYRLNIGVSVMVSVLVISVAMFLYASNFTFSKDTQKTTLRTGSVKTLTGRTKIWEETFSALSRKPFFGFGFGMTGKALTKAGNRNSYFTSNSSKFLSIPTLHNGYIQALADSGYIGGILYTIIIIVTLATFFRKSVIAEHGLEFYLVVFLAVGNLAESLIFKASTLQSTLFWYLVIIGLNMRYARSIANKDKAVI